MGHDNRSQWDKVPGLEKTWDEIIGRGEVRSAPRVGGPNPYQAEFSESAINTEDQNLLTSFMLLTTAGFDQPVGVMMSQEAEHVIPYTLTKLHLARERARENNNPTSSQMKEIIRGQTIMIYSWGFTMSRTGKLTVSDQDILREIYAFADTNPDTDERRRLTKSAENKLENTIGTILQAIKAAEKKDQTNVKLFYTGALMALYALANLHYGKSTSFTDIV